MGINFYIKGASGEKVPVMTIISPDRSKECRYTVDGNQEDCEKKARVLPRTQANNLAQSQKVFVELLVQFVEKDSRIFRAFNLDDFGQLGRIQIDIRQVRVGANVRGVIIC